ncbi:MAG TPA: tRNA (adenosine(37)-N6)-threonylcarbamoyltransferase complex dimerization subunit type 1 TsaB, partial [Candidatus Saccharimonadales bacterium]|nr:tRNA (adenosine(37)-N6)-threonylcarbamoyltransferase complex dimerization subunit type 1 TsaB [Candidatus Saccharimonadales bacterium]
KQEIAFNRGQVVLPIIDRLLKDHGLTPQSLDSIEVNAGPGSFTGVRVGVSIANALSFSLGIPVNGLTLKENGKLVEVLYE